MPTRAAQDCRVRCCELDVQRERRRFDAAPPRRLALLATIPWRRAAGSNSTPALPSPRRELASKNSWNWSQRKSSRKMLLSQPCLRHNRRSHHFCEGSMSVRNTRLPSPFPTAHSPRLPASLTRARLRRPEPVVRSLSAARIGVQVRALRMAAGLSAGQLAAASEISASMLSRIERGLVSPSWRPWSGSRRACVCRCRVSSGTKPGGRISAT